MFKKLREFISNDFMTILRILVVFIIMGFVIAIVNVKPKSDTVAPTPSVSPVVDVDQVLSPLVDPSPTVVPTTDVDNPDLVKDYKVKNIKSSIERTIYYRVEVNAYTVQQTINALALLRQMNSDPILIVIDSPGGSIVDGLKLINAVRYSSVQVNTLCEGMCASMGAFLHQAGKKRYMSDRSMLMFHNASGGLRGSFDQMRSQLKTFDLMVERMLYESNKPTGLTYKQWRDLVARDYWIEAQDAKKLNLTNDIVQLEITYNSPAEVGSEITITDLQMSPLLKMPKSDTDESTKTIRDALIWK